MAIKTKNAFRFISLSNEITTNNVSKAIEDILYFNEEDKVRLIEDPRYKAEPISIIVNSEGGSVYDGFGLVDVIEKSHTPIYITGYGCIMSMALLILTAGHKRSAGKLTTFMYHEVKYGIVEDKIQYHLQELDESRRIQKVYNDYFLSRTKFPKDVMEDVISRRSDYYFDANRAKEYGIINKIL